MFRTIILILGTGALLAFGGPNVPDGLGATIENDYLVLPPHVQNVRVMDDGTWVVATHGDPLKRRGLAKGEAEGEAAIRWIPGDELAPFAEPVAVHIDLRGSAWFRQLDPHERHYWIVSDGAEVRQLLASTNTAPIAHAPVGTMKMRASFRGVPWETSNGELWLLSTAGVHRWGDGALDTYPVRIGVTEAGRSMRWSARDGIREGLGGQVLISSGTEDTVPNEAEEGETPTNPVWLYAPGWNGIAASSVPGSGGRQVIAEPGGLWLLSAADRPELEIWRPDASPLPAELNKLVGELGAPTHREREAASRAIRRQFGTWRGQLRSLRDAAADPEVRQRLDAILSGFQNGEQAPSPAERDAEDGLRSFPNARRLVVPRSLDPGHTYLCLKGETAATDDPRPERWSLFAFGQHGSVEEVAPDLPDHWAPSPALDAEQVSAFDLARIDERTFAWRDGLGGLCVLRDGKRVQLAPPPGGPARFPLPQCRILSVWPGGVVVRLHRRVLVITTETLREAPVKEVPAPAALEKELRTHTAKFVEEYKNYYNSDLDQEQLLKLAERVLSGAPNYRRGLHARGELRYGLSDKNGSRIALLSTSQAMGLGRERTERVLQRAGIWAGLGKNLEAARDMNQVLEVEQSFEGVNLSSYLLRRGNHFLEAERWRTCLKDFRQAIVLSPDNHVARNNIAWVLAASPDEEVRDGKEAIRLALIVCEAEEYESSYSIDTLAAAYAETGNFDKAVEMQEKAVALLDPNDDKQRWRELNHHLKLFKAKKPVRLPEPSFEPEEEEEEEKDGDDEDDKEEREI